MSIFDKFKRNNTNLIFVGVHLNARFQPIHRFEFEDIIEGILKKHKVGELLGGGSSVMVTGEVSSCDMEFNIREDKIDSFVSFLHQLDFVPKGSFVSVGDEKIEVGCVEGLGLYLNGTDLDADVYKNNDINELLELLDGSLTGVAERQSYWEGSAVTAIYYYGKSYKDIQEIILPIIETHPLCEKCKLQQIA